MSEDPLRLKDSGAADLRDLLHEGAHVQSMSNEDREAILAGIGAAGVAGGTAAVASTIAKGSAPFVASKAVMLVLSLAAVGALGTVLVLSRSVARAPVAPAASAPVAETLAPAASASALVVPSVSSVPVAESASPVPVPNPPRATAASASAPTLPPRDEADTLSAESALIAKARGGIESNPTDALTVLGEHARRFPRGELAAERDFLVIKALRKIGKADEARSRARDYETKYPSSPYTPAVRAIGAAP